MCYENYDNLKNAIVLQAVQDYYHVQHKLKTCPNDAKALLLLQDVVSFFNSDWCEELTDIDGKSILQKLEHADASVSLDYQMMKGR